MSREIKIDPDSAAYARRVLIEWHEGERRDFPWRHESDPYRILMAEMMLRRTQARQVTDVYRRFVEHYPNPEILNSASSEEVMAVLSPLGLSWRARNFKQLAYELVTRHNGRVPREREALVALTGVGPYVADAVLCFAFGSPTVLVDTNTVRVAARYFGFEYNPESRRRPEVIRAVGELIDPKQAAHSNYAVLDLAATTCRAMKPRHGSCPLAFQCAFFQHSIGRLSDNNEATTGVEPSDNLHE